MAIKVVKSLTVSGLPSGTWKILSGNPDHGEKTPAIDASTLEDARKVKVAGPQPEDSSLKLKLAQDNQARPATGVPATITITQTNTDGTTRSVPVSGSLVSVEPGEIAVGGERIPTWDCEFQPDGTVGTTAAATTV